MANDNSGKTTIEQGGSGILEKGRPDGLGSPSNDQPVLPSRQPIPTPRDITKRRK